MSTGEAEGENGVPGAKKSKQEKISDGMRRWNILKEVLMRGRSLVHESDSSVSVRRFKSYDLLQTEPISVPQQQTFTGNGDWFKYTANICPDFRMDIRHLCEHVTPEALRGFNNTGNVCVWPAEEVLTYYCLKNIDTFRKKSVIELGGGMTCLAGVALGVTSEASYIELTDGNEDSVANLDVIIQQNSPKVNTVLKSRLLRWGSGPLDADLAGKFDIVLCADCLFFKDGREDLIKTVQELMTEDGECIMFAPKRGETFDEFVDLARNYFQVNVQQQYDEPLWQTHCKMKEKGLEHYDSNIHYPWYIKLTNLPTFREDSSER